MGFDPSKVNTSHIIHHFFFGDTFQMQRALEHIENGVLPMEEYNTMIRLSDTVYYSTENDMTQEHYIKVVDTLQVRRQRQPQHVQVHGQLARLQGRRQHPCGQVFLRSEPDGGGGEGEPHPILPLPHLPLRHHRRRVYRRRPHRQRRTHVHAVPQDQGVSREELALERERERERVVTHSRKGECYLFYEWRSSRVRVECVLLYRTLGGRKASRFLPSLSAGGGGARKTCASY